LIALRLNPTSGTPLYLQLVERLKHSIATGAIKAGEQLPSVRKMAEDLVINPNTVVRAYVFVRESVAGRTSVMKKAEPIVRSAVDRLEALDLTEDEVRRLLENELALRGAARETRKRRA
jgi:GntR family transcriptional regulator